MSYYVFTEDQLQLAIKLWSKQVAEEEAPANPEGGDLTAEIINDFMHSDILSAMDMRRNLNIDQGG